MRGERSHAAERRSEALSHGYRFGVAFGVRCQPDGRRPMEERWGYRPAGAKHPRQARTLSGAGQWVSSARGASRTTCRANPQALVGREHAPAAWPRRQRSAHTYRDHLGLRTHLASTCGPRTEARSIFALSTLGRDSPLCPRSGYYAGMSGSAWPKRTNYPARPLRSPMPLRTLAFHLTPRTLPFNHHAYDTTSFADTSTRLHAVRAPSSRPSTSSHFSSISPAHGTHRFTI